MNHLLDTELDRDEGASAGDREISLGPGTILGIFFALALLCGAVFGLGYSMGRRSGQNAVAPVIIGNGSPALSSLSTAKPDAGSAAPSPVRTAAEPLPAASAPVTSRANVAASDAMIAGDKLPRQSAAQGTQTVATPVTASAPPAPTAGGTFMVQIAAVSTQDIADLELAALRKFNYPVVVRHEPTDQLLHIQLGPYATRKDAEAMRQNVLSHGFNAIIK